MNTFDVLGNPIGNDNQIVLVTAGSALSGGKFDLDPFVVLGNDGTCNYQIDVLGAMYMVQSGAEQGIGQTIGDVTRDTSEHYTSQTGSNTRGVLTSRWGDQSGATIVDAGSANQLVAISNGFRLQGQSAGDNFFEYPWGMWASYQRSDFEDDFAARAFDGDRDLVMFGADVSPWENSVFGVALGYENNEIDTTFNAGSVDIDGITVAPYMGFLLNDPLGTERYDVVVDFTIGYSDLDIDQVRTAGGARITASTESDRVFFASNVSVSRRFNDLYLTGLAGLLVARDEVDGYTESDGTVVGENEVDLGQLRIGADAAYSWGSFEPFASAIFSHDYERQKIGGGHPNDSNEVQLGFGLRYFSEHGFTGSVEYRTSLAREDYDEDSLTFTVRGEF